MVTQNQYYYYLINISKHGYNMIRVLHLPHIISRDIEAKIEQKSSNMLEKDLPK